MNKIKTSGLPGNHILGVPGIKELKMIEHSKVSIMV